jgi:hypothetical protein
MVCVGGLLSISSCDDDTTVTTVQDMTVVTAHDMAVASSCAAIITCVNKCTAANVTTCVPQCAGATDAASLMTLCATGTKTAAQTKFCALYALIFPACYAPKDGGGVPPCTTPSSNECLTCAATVPGATAALTACTNG